MLSAILGSKEITALRMGTLKQILMNIKIERHKLKTI